MNSNGDNTDPWGRPYSEQLRSDPTLPLILSLTLLVVRKVLISFKIWIRRRTCLVSRIPGTDDIDAVEERQNSVEKVVANWMRSFDALGNDYHALNI